MIKCNSGLYDEYRIFKRRAFVKIEIFCNIIIVFIVTFQQFVFFMI